MNEELHGFVIAQQPYKDDGLLLSVISEHGVVDVIAPHVLKVNNKNHSCTQLYTEVIYQCQRRNEQHRYQLLSGQVVKVFPQLYDHILMISALELVAQCIRVWHSDEVWFEYWRVLLPQSPSSYPLVIAIMLKQLIVDGGYLPNVDGCYRCGSQLIDGISMEGGFVCQLCDQHLVRHNKHRLRQWRYLFKSELVNFADLIPFDYDWMLVITLLDYIDYHQSLPVKAYRFFKETWRMLSLQEMTIHE
jgi:DNA repair protein RecO